MPRWFVLSAMRNSRSISKDDELDQRRRSGHGFASRSRVASPSECTGQSTFQASGTLRAMPIILERLSAMAPITAALPT